MKGRWMNRNVINAMARYVHTGFITIALCIGTLIFFPQKTYATPLNNVQDTLTIHSVKGTDKFFTKTKGKGEISFNLSPFYQHTNTARNDGGTRVLLGERLGKWNMLGLFYGPAAAPKDFESYTALNGAKTDVSGLNTITTYSKDITKEENYDPDNADIKLGSFDKVDLRFEKLGVRSQLTMCFDMGFGLSIKGGVVNYKQSPTFSYPTTSTATPAAASGGEGGAAPAPTATTSELRVKLNECLMSAQKRDAIFKDLDIDVKDVQKSALEDMHMQVFWTHPFDLKDKSETAVTVAPYIAAGVWLPTGDEQNSKKAFSLATGNDGFFGITTELALNFDFPGMIQMSIGGGSLFFNSRELTNYRVPSSLYQSGIYPWKTSISKEPGITWYANASLKAESFIPDMSLYLDYVFSYHDKDTITLKEKDSTRRAAFATGLPRLIDESAWKNQQFNLGLKYNITKTLAFGGLIQAHISGVRVYRGTTFLGSMTLSF